MLDIGGEYIADAFRINKKLTGIKKDRKGPTPELEGNDMTQEFMDNAREAIDAAQGAVNPGGGKLEYASGLTQRDENDVWKLVILRASYHEAAKDYLMSPIKWDESYDQQRLREVLQDYVKEWNDRRGLGVDDELQVIGSNAKNAILGVDPAEGKEKVLVFHFVYAPKAVLESAGLSPSQHVDLKHLQKFWPHHYYSDAESLDPAKVTEYVDVRPSRAETDDLAVLELRVHEYFDIYMGTSWLKNAVLPGRSGGDMLHIENVFYTPAFAGKREHAIDVTQFFRMMVRAQGGNQLVIPGHNRGGAWEQLIPDEGADRIISRYKEKNVPAIGEILQLRDLFRPRGFVAPIRASLKIIYKWKNSASSYSEAQTILVEKLFANENPQDILITPGRLWVTKAAFVPNDGGEVDLKSWRRRPESLKGKPNGEFQRSEEMGSALNSVVNPMRDEEGRAWLRRVQWQDDQQKWVLLGEEDRVRLKDWHKVGQGSGSLVIWKNELYPFYIDTLLSGKDPAVGERKQVEIEYSHWIRTEWAESEPTDAEMASPSRFKYYASWQEGESILMSSSSIGLLNMDAHDSEDNIFEARLTEWDMQVVLTFPVALRMRNGRYEFQHFVRAIHEGTYMTNKHPDLGLISIQDGGARVDDAGIPMSQGVAGAEVQIGNMPQRPAQRPPPRSSGNSYAVGANFSGFNPGFDGLAFHGGGFDNGLGDAFATGFGTYFLLDGLSTGNPMEIFAGGLLLF